MAQLDLLDPPPLVQASRKSESAYKTISEVSQELDVPQHVLRFWENHFPQVKPSRMRGARRYYRPEDIELLKKIKMLLYQQGYTIKGAKKAVKDKNHLPDSPPPETKEASKQAAQMSGKKGAKPDVKILVNELRVLKSMLATLL